MPFMKKVFDKLGVSGDQGRSGDQEKAEIQGPEGDPNRGAIAKIEDFEKAWSKIDGPPKRQVTAVVIGAGLRGTGYAHFASDFPARLKIVGVAEPKPHRRADMKKEHDIPDDHAVSHWEQLEKKEKLADIAIIATQDRLHKDPAIAFARKGYHLLLEKPVSVVEHEVEEIAEECKKAGVMVSVCHVMRYHPPCIKIREIIKSGKIGKVVTINHTENILYWHFAHSFVRGNWRNESESSFSLLAKSCHDIDLISYWMGDDKCTKIQSFGGLHHFKASERPQGASDRCFGCKVEKNCPYSAQKIYMKEEHSRPSWPMSAVCDIEDHPKGYFAALKDALQTGPYGRCVYACDNDVCDHQSVNMEFESGATATMTMNAFTRNMCRETRITGTMGELRWNGGKPGPILVYDFLTQHETGHYPDLKCPPVKTGGHGGADFFLFNAFVKAVASDDVSFIKSGMQESLNSHKLVFAAERSRHQNKVETMTN